MNELKDLLTLEQASSRIGCSRNTTMRSIAAGRLEAVKVGRRTLVRSEALDAFLANLPRARAA